ncbi:MULTISPECIES: Fpg/Nei family DNA glycosylase [Streptomyces]|uniref:DNA-(apurinic or apyrimidinic site) lyase n=2 Tax=Streptomyces TaxID=1883 RepID=A0A3R7ES87_9ACTN|nr:MULTISPECIES: DNA-formamidopyrimidine glycosylase family protein [Streptomyces]KNE79975.1 DNA glycosylase [Streptomyces fradiae]OFA58166.1 DNA glycosylase [Streptomyces fradiae]PQM21979.1 Fpg/Nei family DNA glycosylase [Streptomyces xinghaiensis]RKM95229.1 Fpg/Nei family DNA glycosylase [Streptomyces xinghaiensis]RNC72815.1 Fpg/Nei family DNA glycosylase [Streptomyces xinghaiensis]
MPEGDTVWRTARRLHEALAGDRLVRCDLRVPKLATADLSGRRVLEVVPRGKHLLSRFEGGLTLHSHLRMDGAWRVFAAGERPRGGPDHEIRAILGTAARTAVGYRLPVLDLLRTGDEDTVVGHLGPDPLGPGWDPEEARRRLLADPARPLGEALLDQRNLAGLGNVYKSELCFMLRLSPWLPVGEVPSPARPIALAAKLLDLNKARASRVTTADPRRDRRLWVYGRAGRPCLRCGTPVRTAGQGEPGRERDTYWCPRCQPGPYP